MEKAIALIKAKIPKLPVRKNNPEDWIKDAISCIRSCLQDDRLLSEVVIQEFESTLNCSQISVDEEEPGFKEFMESITEEAKKTF